MTQNTQKKAPRLSVRINIKLSEVTHAKLKMWCIRQGLTLQMGLPKMIDESTKGIDVSWMLEHKAQFATPAPKGDDPFAPVAERVVPPAAPAPAAPKPVPAPVHPRQKELDTFNHYRVLLRLKPYPSVESWEADEAIERAENEARDAKETAEAEEWELAQAQMIAAKALGES